MNKKYQIFISSTYTDLIEERKYVQDVITKMEHFPVGMEIFSASSTKQWDIIKRTIDLSDYYILIIGYRYGSEMEDGISYTEREFLYAKEQGVPIIAFIKEEGLSVKEKDIELLPKGKKLQCFIEKVKEDREIEWWKTKEELGNKVLLSLHKEFIQNERYGWIRNDKNMFKYDNEYQNKETIKDHYSVSYVKKRKDIDRKLNPLENMFINVCSLNIATVSGINLLDVHSKKILNLLNKKVGIKMVVLKAGTEAFKEHFSNKLDSLEHLKKGSETTWESWMEICDRYDNFKLKYTDICLPYNILYVEKNNKEDSFIKVDLYSINAEPNDRPCLYIKSTDEMFSYFVEQFRLIWEWDQICKLKM